MYQQCVLYKKINISKNTYTHRMNIIEREEGKKGNIPISWKVFGTSSGSGHLGRGDESHGLNSEK